MVIVAIGFKDTEDKGLNKATTKAWTTADRDGGRGLVGNLALVRLLGRPQGHDVKDARLHLLTQVVGGPAKDLTVAILVGGLVVVELHDALGVGNLKLVEAVVEDPAIGVGNGLRVDLTRQLQLLRRVLVLALGQQADLKGVMTSQ